MAVIRIEDFTGGRNRHNPLLIADNECTVTSRNVLASAGVLTKGYGIQEIGTSLTATASYIDRLFNSNLAASGENRLVLVVASAGVDATGSALATGGMWFTDDISTFAPIGYVTGSVSISGASLISATGNGTAWNTHIQAGDYFRVDATASGWFKVSSVEDATHLTLSAAVPVAVATGAAYTILKQLNLNYPAAMGMLNGLLFASDWSNQVQSYNGTQCLNVTAAQRVRFLTPHKFYLFGARTTTAESRVYWSSINDGTVWPANNFIDVDKEANGKIVGLYSYGNELIVAKQRKFYKILGDTFDPANPTYTVLPIAVPDSFFFPQNGNYGIVAHEGVLYFWGWDGLYRYWQGTPRVQKVSLKFDGGNGAGAIEIGSDHVNATKRNSRANIWSSSYRGFIFTAHLITTTTGGGEPGLSIIDEKGSLWRYYSNSDVGFPISSLTPGGSGTIPIRLLAALGKGTTSDAHLVNIADTNTAFVNTSGGNVSIDSFWQSKIFNVRFAAFKHLVVYFEKESAGNLTVGWRIDGAAAVNATVDMTVGRGPMIRKVLDINQRGSTIQIELSNNTVSQTFRIYGVEIFYTPDEENRLT